MAFTKEQRRLTRRLYDFLIKRRFHAEYLLGDDQLVTVEYGLIDPYLSRLCAKGNPLHHSRKDWERHLNSGQDYTAKIRSLTQFDLAVHLFGRPGAESTLSATVAHVVLEERVYQVGPSAYGSEHLLVCLDLDDKHHRRGVKALLKRLLKRFPLFRKNGYIEYSPSGRGIHIYMILHHPNVPKSYVNELLSKLGEYIAAQANSLDPRRPKVDDFKSTCSWNASSQENGTRTRVAGCMGTMASSPRPQTMKELDRLVNLPVVELNDLASILPTEEIEDIGEPSESGSGPQAICNMGSTTLFVPIQEDCRSDDNEDGTANHGKDNGYAPVGRPPRSRGKETIESIRSIANGLQRKVHLCMYLARKHTRVPTLRELAKAYHEEGMEGNSRKTWRDRKKDFASAINFCRKRFKPSWSGSGLYQERDYDFVDQVDFQSVQQFFPKGSRPESVIGVLKAFLCLVERPIRKRPSHIFTAGVKQLQGYVKALKRYGTIPRLSTNRRVICYARTIALRLGLVVLLSLRAPGSSERYGLGPKHPRVRDYIEKYGEQMKAYRFGPGALKQIDSALSTRLPDIRHREDTMALAA